VHPVGTGDRAHLRPAPTIAVVIPSRYASTRLPGKPLAEIGGRPMIAHVHEKARAIAGAGRVIVATDDERVAEAVRAIGGEAWMTRADHRSGTDRLAEVAARLDSDLIVNVQGDEPLVDPGDVGAAVAALAADPELAITTLRYPIRDAAELASPHVVKVVVSGRGRALYFSRAPVPHWRDHGGAPAPRLAFKHIGVYVYRRAALLAIAALPPTPLELAESLEQLRALEHGFAIGTTEARHDATGVDTPADLDHVRRLLAGSPAR
jgi:3-deoxy-manno-octulosonate cytidylyltransferase (CMP-KDO synthetase)